MANFDNSSLNKLNNLIGKFTLSGTGLLNVGMVGRLEQTNFNSSGMQI